MIKGIVRTAALLAPLLLTATAEAGPVMDAVKARGSFKCGLGGSTPGFGFPDDKGVWQGFNATMCRAVAVAMFNDPGKVDVVSMSPQQRLTALQTGEIELLASSTTITLTRDTKLGLNFMPPVFYDGQGFMVKKSLGVTKAADLKGATICIQPGTTTELNIADYFRKNKMSYTPVVIENVAEIRTAFNSGRCDVISDDVSGLAASRVVATNPADYVILPERISKEPLAPAVRHGDDQWYDLATWSIRVLIEAEELGIDSKNVDQMLTSTDPSIRRLLGVEPGLGQALGVDQKFAYNIVKTLGNYSEVYEKWLGVNSPLKIERGLNNLWTKGGLHYSPPFR